MSTEIAKRTSISDLVTSKVVPDLVKNTISQDDWDAMPADQRQPALEFFLAEMQNTTEGLDITFPRIKYPTSGSGVFEIPGAKEPEYAPKITAVVVHKQVVRAYWPIGDPIANNPPKCSSPDGIRPLDGPGRQADTCAECVQSQFGSGKESTDGQPGKGQACKQRINTFLLRDHNGSLEEIPTLLSFPPTAIKPFSDFAVQLRKANLTLLSQRIVIGLTDAKNSTGTSYKGIVLSLGDKLTYPEMVSSRQIADAFRGQMEKRGAVVEDDKPVETHAPSGPQGGTIIDAKAETVHEEAPHPAMTARGQTEKIPY